MELTTEDLARMAQAYKKDAAQQIVEQAVKNNGIHASSERESVVVTKNNFVFSVDVDDEAVANQRQSGRCWMYSALNFLRFHMEKKLKLPKGSFELSQAYNFFYDKLEKSNFFMENIIKYAGSDLNDRRIDFLLATPQQDGGDFDPIVALVEKYGVVPEEAMPETAVTKNSSELDALLNRMLREDAYALRKLVAEGKSEADIEEARKSMLSDIYRVLCVSFGEPPQTVDFVYRDTDKKYHADRGLTPLEFYKKYLGDVKLDDCIGVINLPVEGMAYNKAYEIDMTGEVLGAKRRCRYVNVPIDVMKQATIKQLKAGEPVWFGCDVLQDSDFAKGIMSLNLYDVQKMMGLEFKLNKGERFQYNQSLPTHAMMIAGVDLDEDGNPIRWKVENSWGTTAHGKPVGHQGYFIMDDSWFTEYNYEVAVRREYLPDDVVKAYDAEPEVLPYWNTFNPEP
ncbi:C1 family peptidase [Bifidobacterium pseudolongum]|uniref:Aminopeptidase n=1 Tax=Bifidobacterium pseudolongum subsp. pseudolongum TaxID=31954 RepID=A0A4Q5A854_9BIFI|nr:C1 family peptidase [Bifidobacterium pseudolongum]MDY3689330.1 C1 family peptidase [Bifidobacterium pseudolongum]PKU99417.1 aminopeptidase C [Bifidobacterium pseudolongum subsp. pseudolongum]RYQ19581.1 aminopeptidase C [Bifidobacterium pseudolongum subsp. pseudolongum]RYQ47720.1 aminopeptidase C [Bifidobacterium pseudolongum subsp. pseudolongum]RYQ51203.1 aminopeptidase C [Bifidobacterium pseudolongum subsp. pseudolongum]